MRSGLFFILVFLVLPAGCAAQFTEVVFLEMRIYNNDNVELLGLYVDMGVPMDFSPKDTGYSLVLYSDGSEPLYSAPLAVDYSVLIDRADGTEIIERESTRLFLRIPYYSDAGRMIVYHGDDVIYELDLRRELCNLNGLCDACENRMSCPQDCAEGSTASRPALVETPATSTVSSTLAASTSSLPRASVGEEGGDDNLLYAGIFVAALVLLFIGWRVRKRMS